jgi:CYTH domain-containing protein
MQAITRKFLVKSLPDLTRKECSSQNRSYLYRKNGIVIRVQSKGNVFELERKVSKTALIRESEKISITKEEFDTLSKIAKDNITRDSYVITETPDIVLQIYHSKFEGLVRVEVRFQSIEEANQFSPPEWMGREITNTHLAKDETLLDLTDQDFQAMKDFANVR